MNKYLKNNNLLRVIYLANNIRAGENAINEKQYIMIQ